MKVTIVTGSDQVSRAIADKTSARQKDYHFDTPEEAAAFLRGIDEGVGWMEAALILTPEVEKVIQGMTIAELTLIQ